MKRELPRTSDDGLGVLGAIEIDRMNAHVQRWDGGLLALINSDFPLPAILGLAEQGLRRPSGMLPTYLRLMECIRLRVKDVDFSYNQIVVRDGKGNKDRVTMLPLNVNTPLQRHLQDVKRLHEWDLKEGFGNVYLPYALDRKYPYANREWAWQYSFPALKRSIDPCAGLERRHHINKLVLQWAVKEAMRKSGIPKAASCHTFRHSFATHVREAGYDICTVQ